MELMLAPRSRQLLLIRVAMLLHNSFDGDGSQPTPTPAEPTSAPTETPATPAGDAPTQA